MSDETDHGSQDETPDVEVSFAEVAVETADESVQHEQEALAETEEAAETAEADGADTVLLDVGVGEDNEAPAQPALTSMLGFGPVSPGDDPVI